MKFINNLVSKAKDTINNAAKSVILDKTLMVSVDKLSFDKDFQEMFSQEEDKVNRIAEDMKLHGFDKSQPIIITDEFIVLDGHSRLQACKIAGINKVPVIVKHFNSKEEAKDYEGNLQINRRNLTEQQIMDFFLKNEQKKGTPEAKTDVQFAEEYNVSPRQVSKMREVEKKASDEIKEQFKAGEISLNKAYVEMKEELGTPVKAAVKTEKPSENPRKPRVDDGKKRLSVKLDSAEFDKLSELAKGSNLSAEEFVLELIMNSIESEKVQETA